MRRFLELLCLLSASFIISSAQYPGAQPPPEDLRKGFDAIKIVDAKRILTFLSTKCEGRGTGQPGFEKAANFVAGQFKRIGLKPFGDNDTYFQKTTFSRVRYTTSHVEFDGPQGIIPVDSKEVTIFNSPDPLKISGSPLFIEYRGATTTLPDSVDVKGRVVFVHGDVPNRRIASEAAVGDAAAVLTVLDHIPAPFWRARMGDQPIGPGSIVTGVISSRAELLLVHASKLRTLGVPGPDSLASTPVEGQFKIEGVREVEKVQVGNVVGLMEGADPTLKSEYVGVGGHLDHLGIQNGVVYPGADDDGSGSTAVIEVAKAMAANPKKPRRSIVFMTFFGEEMGLLGSRFLTQHPPVPLDKMVAELQMDMVGRDSDGVQNGDRSRIDVAAQNVDTIRLVGSKRISTELDKEIQDMNKFIGFKFKYDAEDVYTRSDHYNFAAKGIPIAFLFDGFHPDYHQPTDTIEKIDWLKLTNAAKLYYLTAHVVADADAPPVKDVSQSREGQ